jgi:hypothetical protein
MTQNATLNMTGISEHDVLLEKLTDVGTPSFQAEFDPDEADRAGALSEQDALDSDIDLLDLSKGDNYG